MLDVGMLEYWLEFRSFLKLYLRGGYGLIKVDKLFFFFQVPIY